MGSATTKVVVGEFEKTKKNPKIIGVGESKTLGLRHGYVVDTEQAVAAVKNAVALAEKTSGIKIKRAFISLGGVSLRGDLSSGSIIISKADSEVTALDIAKALDDAVADGFLEVLEDHGHQWLPLPNRSRRNWGIGW